jgi:hypothetical protein
MMNLAEKVRPDEATFATYLRLVDTLGRLTLEASADFVANGVDVAEAISETSNAIFLMRQRWDV